MKPVIDYKEFPLINTSKATANGISNPMPMQYLGSKSRISNWILNKIGTAFPNASSFVDLFAGTGSVSISAKEKGYRLYINDIQPYAFIVLKALFQSSRLGIRENSESIQNLKSDGHLLASGRHEAKTLLFEEREEFAKFGTSEWEWEKYKGFCDTTPLVGGSIEEIKKLKEKNYWSLFTKYYSNTYFGVEQCLQLDAIREFAESLPTDNRNQVIAATITAMTYGVSSTTHLAQFLKPTTNKRSQKLVLRRRYDFIEEVAKRLIRLSKFQLPEQSAEVHQLDYKNALYTFPMDNNSVIYVDPPYFKEHYSRYYHVLDTFYLYDYPTLTFNPRIGTTTVGRYRDDRIVSDFGLKSSVQEAFSFLFGIAKEKRAKLAVSYANTSLVGKDQLLNLAKKAGLSSTVEEIRLMHSGQGQPRNNIVTEYLFLMEPSN